MTRLCDEIYCCVWKVEGFHPKRVFGLYVLVVSLLEPELCFLAFDEVQWVSLG